MNSAKHQTCHKYDQKKKIKRMIDCFLRWLVGLVDKVGRRAGCLEWLAGLADFVIRWLVA